MCALSGKKQAVRRARKKYNSCKRLDCNRVTCLGTTRCEDMVVRDLKEVEGAGAKALRSSKRSGAALGFILNGMGISKDPIH